MRDIRIQRAQGGYILHCEDDCYGPKGEYKEAKPKVFTTMDSLFTALEEKLKQKPKEKK